MVSLFDIIFDIFTDKINIQLKHRIASLNYSFESLIVEKFMLSIKNLKMQMYPVYP